jgi:hypothetical protein
VRHQALSSRHGERRSTIDAAFGGRVGEEHVSQFRGEATPVFP